MKDFNRKLHCYIKNHWRGVLALSISTLFLLVTLFPLIRLSLYSAPYYDDYNFALYTKRALENGGGIFAVFRGVLECGISQWKSWQGAYSCSGLSALAGIAFGDDMYFIGPLFIITFFTGSAMFFWYKLIFHVFKANKLEAMTLSVIFTGVLVNLIHVPNEGFYWFNGGVAYVGMYAFLCLYIGAVIDLVLDIYKKSGKILLIIVSVIIAFILGGANYVTALHTAELIAFILMICIYLNGYNKYLKNEKRYKYVNALPSMIAFYAGFIINIISPGNATRSEALSESGIGAFDAIKKSFEFAISFNDNYFGMGMFVTILIIAFPIVWLYSRKTEFSFKSPGIVTFVSVCFYASSFTPGLYALDNPGAGRTINVIKFTFLTLIIINYIYWTGAFSKTLEKFKKADSSSVRRSTKKDIAFVVTYFIVACLLVVIVFFSTNNRVVSYPSWGAYYYTASGLANNFKTEYGMRMELLNSDSQDVVVKKYNYAPSFLLVKDWSDNPDDEMNRYIARWYNKRTVICDYE